MNLLALSPLWLILVLCALLVVAAVEDAIRLRISNLTVLAVIGSAIFAIIAAGISPALWQNVVVFLALLAAGTILFSAGMLGGGDVKLFSAVALWMNLNQALMLVAAVLIAGGLIAVLILLSRLLFGRANRGALRDRTTGIPYAVAIAIGALFVVAFDREIAGDRHPNPLDFRQFEAVAAPVAPDASDRAE